MSETTHSAATVVPVGHKVCTCGTLVIAEIAQRTGGQCSDCFARAPRAKVIELAGRGARTQVPMSRRPNRKRTETPARKQREKLREQAKRRADRRLAAIFTDVYDILVAEERAKLGLDPWPLETAIRKGPDPTGEQSLAFARVAAELERVGASPE